MLCRLLDDVICSGMFLSNKCRMSDGSGYEASWRQAAAVFTAALGLQGMSDEAITVEQFCRRYVEPMGEESDHVHIVALTDALQVCTQALSWYRMRGFSAAAA